MNEPFVSIIVAVKNAEKTIEKSIDSILNIDYANYELIVVDDGSTDKTSSILKKYMPKITGIANPKCIGPAKSRNIAAELAKGEYLAFTDADCIVYKSWIKELLLGFNEPKVVSVGGRQEMPENETAFGRNVANFMKKIGFISDYMRPDTSGFVFVNHNASCNVIYKRDIFLNAEGFLTDLWPGEDVELDYRLKKRGFKILCNPRAMVKHYRPEKFTSFIKMMYRYGWAQGFLVKRYGIFRRIQIVPFISLVIGLSFGFIFYKSLLVFLILSDLSLFLVLAWSGFDFLIFALFLFAFFSWNLGFFRKLLLP